MKTLLIVTIFLANCLFANYTYTNENSGKIDMHGGKGEKLLGNISKPLMPTPPTPLIKQDTKESKKEDKKQ